MTQTKHETMKRRKKRSQIESFAVLSFIQLLSSYVRNIFARKKVKECQKTLTIIPKIHAPFAHHDA